MSSVNAVSAMAQIESAQLPGIPIYSPVPPDSVGHEPCHDQMQKLEVPPTQVALEEPNNPIPQQEVVENSLTTNGPTMEDDDEVQFIFSAPRRRKKKRRKLEAPDQSQLQAHGPVAPTVQVQPTIIQPDNGSPKSPRLSSPTSNVTNPEITHRTGSASTVAAAAPCHFAMSEKDIWSRSGSLPTTAPICSSYQELQPLPLSNPDWESLSPLQFPAYGYPLPWWCHPVPDSQANLLNFGWSPEQVAKEPSKEPTRKRKFQDDHEESGQSSNERRQSLQVSPRTNPRSIPANAENSSTTQIVQQTNPEISTSPENNGSITQKPHQANSGAEMAIPENSATSQTLSQTLHPSPLPANMPQGMDLTSQGEIATFGSHQFAGIPMGPSAGGRPPEKREVLQPTSDRRSSKGTTESTISRVPSVSIISVTKTSLSKSSPQRATGSPEQSNGVRDNQTVSILPRPSDRESPRSNQRQNPLPSAASTTPASSQLPQPHSPLQSQLVGNAIRSIPASELTMPSQRGLQPPPSQPNLHSLMASQRIITPPRTADMLRKPSLYSIPAWPSPTCPPQSSEGSLMIQAPVPTENGTSNNPVIHQQPLGIRYSRYPTNIRNRPHPSENPTQQPTMNANPRTTMRTPSTSSSIRTHPQPRRTSFQIPSARMGRKYSPNLIVDIAETCQELFPFSTIAERHNVPIKKVFDTFSAIIQLPLLRNADDRRRHGSLAKTRMKEYRDAKKKMEEERKAQLKGVRGGKGQGSGGGVLLKTAVLNSVRGGGGVLGW